MPRFRCLCKWSQSAVVEMDTSGGNSVRSKVRRNAKPKAGRRTSRSEGGGPAFESRRVRRRHCKRNAFSSRDPLKWPVRDQGFCTSGCCHERFMASSTLVAAILAAQQCALPTVVGGHVRRRLGEVLASCCEDRICAARALGRPLDPLPQENCRRSFGIDIVIVTPSPCQSYEARPPS